MAHMTSIAASRYSDLSVHMAACLTNAMPAGLTLPTDPTALTSNWDAGFTTCLNPTDAVIAESTAIVAGDFIRINNIREFPAIGTPPNIVNVPVYGSPTSKQVQGQSDAPSMELTINYIPAVWADSTRLGKLVGSGVACWFRFTLLDADPGSALSSLAADATGTATFTVANSQYFFLGKIEALVVNPQLTDATTATVTISVQSQMYGAFTV